MISYTVSATFVDATIAEEWIAWLRDEHLSGVLAGGAVDAEIIRVDHDPSVADETRFEVRYHFATRVEFDAYVRDHAPRLRTEGLKRFSPERGICYERTVGEVSFRLTK